MAAMRLAGAFSPKVRRGLAGSREWCRQLEGAAADGRFRIHFHAASVGEFEQAKPLIDALRASDPGYCITASFFSPSGYEQQRGYAALDGACHLPRDRRGEMRAFLDRIAPDLIIVIRYDLWPEFLLEARRRGIPIVLACGVLRDGSARFYPLIRGFFRMLYALPALIHAVGEDDAAAFRRLVPGCEPEVSGDTRYDRVIARARAAADLPAFTPGLIAGRAVMVAGSTWPPDEELLKSVGERDDLLLVIVPHEPTPDHVGGLLRSFPGAVTLSQVEQERAPERACVIVIDRTGILSALYRIGAMAYVGGGFGDGVHSVLEPAAYGMPVFSGPGVDRSRDAAALRDAGGLVVVRSGNELAGHVARLIDDPGAREETGNHVRAFVESRTGATGRIIGSLARRGLLR